MGLGEVWWSLGCWVWRQGWVRRAVIYQVRGTQGWSHIFLARRSFIEMRNNWWRRLGCHNRWRSRM